MNFQGLSRGTVHTLMQMRRNLAGASGRPLAAVSFREAAGHIIANADRFARIQAKARVYPSRGLAGQACSELTSAARDLSREGRQYVRRTR